MARSNTQISRRKAIALASATAVLPGGFSMAQHTEDQFYYYLNFRAIGAWYIARINGATISDRSTVELADFIVPINHYLKSGENVLELIFVPTFGDEWPAGEPNPEFAARATLRQLNLRSRAEEEIGLVNVDFDMETGNLVERGQTSLGSSRAAGRPDFGRIDPMEIEDGTYTDIYGPPVDARVMRVRFTIPSELPPFPWEAGQVMRDTAHLRTELAAAYSDVHTALSSGDFNRVFALYEPAWSRAAVAMAYEDAEDFVAVNEVQTKLVPVTSDGNPLGPLTFQPSLREARLELMSDGRLAHFDPTPIFWTNPDDPTRRAIGTRIAFFRDQTGTLKIGLVLYDF